LSFHGLNFVGDVITPVNIQYTTLIL